MGTRKSSYGSQHQFAQIPSADIPRSQFNRSGSIKTTFDAGLLVPVFVDEVLPGDTYNVRMNTFARFNTLLFPILDNVYLDSFFFFVPNRLLWSNWERFNGAQDDPGDSTDFLIPQMVAGPAGHGIGQLSDYFGIPTGIPDLTHSSLWHRAYNLIFNSWFRDENLQDSAIVDLDDGPDTVGDYPILTRGKRHDYFTSCLPFVQKGASVTLPVGAGTVPVVPDTLGIPKFDRQNDEVADAQLHTTLADPTLSMTPSPITTGNWKWSSTVGLEVNIAGGTINELREAFAIQKVYERDARGGTRYTEIIRQHFSVTSPDQRLQRPEYLGGGSQPVNVTAVPQTSSTDGTSPQANLSAYGISSGSNHSFVKSFTEHGVLIGIVSARADINYQQGLSRMFSRRSRFDFYLPAFQALGEQAVLNKEIYAQGSDAPGVDDLVFGYQARWDEYRHRPGMITGLMRSTAAGTLDPWHLAQEFTALPTLGATFIQEAPPIDRIVSVPAEPDFKFDGWFDIKCARPMPTYSVPGMIDRF